MLPRDLNSGGGEQEISTPVINSTGYEGTISFISRIPAMGIVVSQRNGLNTVVSGQIKYLPGRQ